MSNDLVPKSKYAATALTEADTYDVTEFAQYTGKVRETVKVANMEIVATGAHGFGTMAELHVGATDLRRRLNEGGYTSQLLDEGQDVIEKITNQHIEMLVNAAQQEILAEAVARIR